MDAEDLEAAWVVVVPLVEADGGEVYLVKRGTTEIHVHLAGMCAGCPGSSMTDAHLFVPAFRRYAPKLTMKLTTGWRIPAGSSRIRVTDGAVATDEPTLVAHARDIMS